MSEAIDPIEANDVNDSPDLTTTLITVATVFTTMFVTGAACIAAKEWYKARARTKKMERFVEAFDVFLDPVDHDTENPIN